MTDYSKILESLSPEKRKLLEQRLKQKAKTFNSFPLSYSQERLWFLDQLYPGSPLYNIPTAVRLKGSLDYKALANSVNKIIARHESLRTRFIMAGETPMQSVSAQLKIDIPLIDLSGLPEDKKQAEVTRLSNTEAQKPFNLSDGPLIRLTLLKTAAEEHVLLLTMHHIISDGWSVGVFIREVGLFYNAEISGQQASMPPLPIQYPDYAVWQKKRLSGEIFEKQMAYWREMLGDNPPALELPTDRPHSAVKSQRGKHLKFTVGQDVLKSLKNISARHGATLFMTMLAAFKTMLYRYSGQDDICVGTPIANRDKIETRGLIGFFINTLAIRSDLSGSPTFNELLERVKSVTLGALSHQDIPFEKLVEELQPERDMTHTPFFQTLFTFQNIPKQAIEIPNLTLEQVEQDIGAVKFDLTININENPGGLNIIIGFNEELFDTSTIERFITHFKTLLQGVAQNPQLPIDRYSLLSEAEEQQLILDFNQTAFEYPKELCAHQLFETQVQKTPQARAVEFLEQSLTYEQLNQQANRLAHYLRKRGIGPEQYVAICMNRSIEMLIAVLAVNKAGGAYVPIDPDHPQDRQAFILEDTGAKILLTQERHFKHLQELPAEVLCLDCAQPVYAGQPKANPKSGVDPHNVAYLIYTSGSTGKPKGVMVQHQGLVNYLKWWGDFYDEQGIQEMPMITNITFDISLKQYYVPLSWGRKVVMVPEETIIQPKELIKVFASLKKAGFNSVQSLWRSLVDTIKAGQAELDPECISCVIVGGEALDPLTLQRTLESMPQVKFFNVYGPTEITATATSTRLKPKEPITIGRPLGNYRLYILDPLLRPVPLGVAGELCIGGVGVARGYLKRPDLTAEKFVPDPFSGDSGDRLYRTGDLTRFLPDGRIDFLGRIDFQVKIRGFRIELGEIEAALAKHPDLRKVLVMAKEDNSGNKQLVAYTVTEEETPPSVVELKKFLKERMPDYMIPKAFVFLDDFPLNRNGKVDRRALLETEISREDFELDYVAPRNQSEEIIANIFSEVLKVNRVGALDNFFELGGHSLIATQVISRIRDQFSIELPLRELFQSPTVEALAAAAEKARMQAKGLEAPPIVPVSRDQKLPLSFAQQRLWFLDQLEPGSSSYNIPKAVRMTGSLDIDALQNSLNEIIRRHEILRTAITTVDGEAELIIEEKLEITIPIIDLSHLNEDKRQSEVSTISQEEATKPFRLDQAPLLRATLLKLKDEDYIFLFTMHHIVSDGWSTGVFIKEIVPLYSAFTQGLPSPLPPLTIQYVDFAAWQRKWLSGKVLEEQLNYWKRTLGNGSPPLQLPTDKPRPVPLTSNGAHFNFKIDKKLSDQINAFCQRENLTPFMAYLAAFMVLLNKYSGQEDISVGTPIANRNRSEIENIIGFFVNTLVMRADLSDDPTVKDFLKQVRETALGAYAHQDLPFEKIVDTIQPERDMRHTPLFQAMFMMQNIPSGKQEASELTINELKVENGLSQFEITLGLTEVRDGLNAGIEYNTDLFEETTMRRLANHFVRIMESIVNQPEQPLSHISLITPEDEKRITQEWNATQRNFPAMAVHDLIEMQAEKQPDKIAVVSNNVQISYGELNEQANSIAAYLQQKGIGKGKRVGLSLRRSPDLIITLLGILKSGAAYVPLDANYPKERLEFMINDAQLSFLITEQALIEAIPAKGIPTLVLDENNDWQQSGTYQPVTFTGDEAAYVIYTSGSTGLPKGVVVSHRSVINHNLAIAEIFEMQDCDRVLQFATINFDAAGEEIYPTLQNGATLILRGNEVLISGQELIELTETYGITIWNLPTAYWHQVLSELKQMDRNIPKTLRLLILGGDKLSAERYREWLQVGGKQVRTLNTYGPTEGTIDSIVFECPKSIEAIERLGEIPIGIPIANTRAYVLEKNLKPAPIGIPGELFLGGTCVAEGYWNRPELTAERFLPDPFADEPDARMYRTGDLVRWRPDGNLEYIGRTDHQVKVRGFRVELEEIEHAILKLTYVKDAAVVAHEKQSDTKQLVAYVVFKDEGSISDLKGELKSRLPEYMVPAIFVQMESLPYLPSGKIDRRALPQPTEMPTERKTEYVDPRNKKERILAEIWQQILGVKEIGVNDNFFELGGDSILSIQVIARARQQGLQITPMQIFQHQTIAGLAAVVQEAQAIKAEQGLVTGTAPFTAIQHWFFDEQFMHSEHWNQSLLLEVHEKLDPTHLQTVTKALLEHHDALRMRIAEENGHRLQDFVLIPQNIPFFYFDLAEMSAEEQEQAIEHESAQLQSSFDLSEGCLLRVAYFDTKKLPHRILIVVHHLAMDGVSWRILLEDVQLAYQQVASGKEIQLPPKTTSFKEWAQKLKEFAASDTMAKEVDYWMEIARKDPPPLFPDYPNGENIERFAGGVADALDVGETKALLNDVPPVYKTEINDILLTALTRAFARWNGKRSLLINMEGHGREEIVEGTDISRTVGWFTSLYPVYLSLDKVFEPGYSIKTIKEQLRAIPNNGIGYGILRYLSPDENLRKALDGLDHAPITFNYLGQFDQALPEGSIFKPAREAKGPERHPQDKRSSLLDITCAITAGKLNMSFTFSRNVFREKTVQPFIRFFKEELKALISHCQSPEAGGFTASDFKLANLDNKKLDKVLSQLQKGKKKKK